MCFLVQRLQADARICHRGFVEFDHALQHPLHAFLQRIDGIGPALGRRCLPAVHGFHQAFTFQAQSDDAFTHRGGSGGFPLAHGLGIFGQLAGERFRSGGDRVEHAFFLQVEFAQEGLVAATQVVQPLRSKVPQRCQLVFETLQCLANRLSDPLDMIVPLCFQSVQLLERCQQVLDLLFGRIARGAYLVVHVTRSIGEHRQLVAKRTHVGHRHLADMADVVDLRGVVVNQVLQPVCIG